MGGCGYRVQRSWLGAWKPWKSGSMTRSNSEFWPATWLPQAWYTRFALAGKSIWVVGTELGIPDTPPPCSVNAMSNPAYCISPRSSDGRPVAQANPVAALHSQLSQKCPATGTCIASASPVPSRHGTSLRCDGQSLAASWLGLVSCQPWRHRPAQHNAGCRAKQLSNNVCEMCM